MAKTKIQDIQSLRFVFIMFVVLSHISANLPPIGAFAVCFFFILSGFILSWAYGEKVESNNFSTFKFVVHQLLKIYPLYVIMQIIMTVYFQSTGLNEISVADFLVNLFLLNTWFPHQIRPFAINAPTWFLCDIFFCYICFKTLFNIVVRSSARKLVVISVLVLIPYISVVLFMPDSKVEDLYDFPIFRMVDFALGIILYRFYISEKGQNLSKRLQSLTVAKENIVGLVFLVFLIIMSCVYNLNHYYGYRYAIFLWPYMFLLIFWFVSVDLRNDIPLIKIFHKRWLIYLGNISMEIFIIHQFVNFVVYEFSLHIISVERTLSVKLCEKVAIIFFTILLSMLANVLLKRWTKWIRNKYPAH